MNQLSTNQASTNQLSTNQANMNQRATKHLGRWRSLAPLGLGVIGLGATLLGHSVGLKSGGASFWTWFVWGTFSLVTLNSGVALFGEAVKHRTLFEVNTPDARAHDGNVHDADVHDADVPNGDTHNADAQS